MFFTPLALSSAPLAASLIPKKNAPSKVLVDPLVSIITANPMSFNKDLKSAPFSAAFTAAERAVTIAVP
jgi:hypothetical protein